MAVENTCDFEGKVAIVTGAAQGLGWATTQWFAHRGATVVGVDRRPDIVEVMTALGSGHMAITCDLVDPKAPDDIVNQVVEKAGALDILVNSAGVALLDSAVDLSAEAWKTTIDINLSAVFYMTQAAGKMMCNQGSGRVVTIASQAASVGLTRHVAYCASKAGLLGMTKVLAAEWARHGVTVNTVSPTVVATELGKKAWAGEVGEKMREQIPVGRFAEPEEIAAAIGYLASPAAAMVTGENLIIDGGYTVV